jgi:alpha-D-xyloside xylohydrolase
MEPTDSYTNHGSIVEYKGQWYSFYHNSKLSEYNEKFNDWTRSVCVDKLFYNADGTIQKVEQTGYGITSNTMPQPAEGLQTKLFKTIDNGIEGELNSLFVRVEFYSPSVVRVYKTPLTELNRRRESRIINPSTEKTDFTVSEDFNYIYLKTAETTVEINKNNGEIHFCSTPNRKYLLLDKVGTSQFTPVANDKGWYRIKETFMLDKDEAVYGLGQIQDGSMSHRNQTIHIEQGNLDDGIPFFQSIKGYGLYWDNYSASTFSDSAEGTSFESEAGEAIDYYFILGGNADGVIRQIRKMTGDCDMFPLWGFGYLQSRERYQSQDELVSVVKKYRELGLPLDGIIQDWRYWGNDDKWNAVEFLDKGFKNPLKMMQDIHALHAHLLISIWPSFSSETTIYKELESENLLYNFKTFPYDEKSAHSVKVYDAFSSSATDIYWKYIKKNMFSKGVDGWWLDATEPEMIQMKPEDWKQPTAIGEFFKVRNLYPYASVGGVYNHQRSASASKRVFILTRSASFGQQRFSSHVWSGDTQASWETLQKQIPTGLNFSLTGIPYWNCDIGGFYFHNYPDKLQDADLRELYVRWFQFAAFCPMFRSHGTNAPREIYQFGKNGDMEYDILEQYLNLRYTLLPYIYSTSWQVTSSQGSMMRALAMDFARDRKVWDMGSEYMFGKSFLVCPVTTPLKNGAATEVYLPKGADWYDYWTNEKLQGGESVKKSTPLDVMPLYVRSGSIIPFAPVMQYATQKKWSDLEIRIYAGADGEFVLYEDENDNYNYQKGTYTAITFTWDEKARTLSVSDRKGSFPKMLLTRTFRITLQDGKNVAAKKITYTGKAQTVKF